MPTVEWAEFAANELGVGKSAFYEIRAELEKGGRIWRSPRGHLAVVNDAADNRWLADTFRPFADSIWIGYSDALKEGEWHGCFVWDEVRGAREWGDGIRLDSPHALGEPRAWFAHRFRLRARFHVVPRCV